MNQRPVESGYGRWSTCARQRACAAAASSRLARSMRTASPRGEIAKRRGSDIISADVSVGADPPARFANRRAAGRALASRLSEYAGRNDVMVLGLPRGGVPVAAEVARALGAPLDVFLVRKLGLPGQEELAMGAIASGGVRVLNEELVSQLRLSPEVIDRVVDAEARELERRERLYRGRRPPPGVRGRTAILVDDGLATGATMRAAVAAL